MIKQERNSTHGKFIKISAIVLITLLLTTPLQEVFTAGIPVSLKSLPEYEYMTQSQNLTLFCNVQNGTIAVEDRRDGYIWKSVVDSEVYDLEGANNQLKSYMTSMIAINHVSFASLAGSTRKSYSSAVANKIAVSKSNNGFSVIYNFLTEGISITLEVVLEGDSLIFKIPVDKISQTGNRALVSIELMPFFGTADHRTDGYIFYPDGSGAITKYSNAAKRPTDVKEYTWNIYGLEQVDLKLYAQRKNNKEYDAMLPVYGIKNGSNALLAAICEGEEDTSIKVAPEGFAVNLNRVYFDLNYRHFYYINLSDITVDGKSMSARPVEIRADREMIQKDREVRMFFLSGDKADYSGMANKYREFLIENNLIKKVIAKNDYIPLALNLFMGIKEERMLFDKFIPMTTFENAVTISEEFKKRGIDSMQVILKGWAKGGYGMYPVNWPPERLLGGKAGLERYAGYASDNNIQLFLQNNFTQALIENGGFSTRKDVVIQGNKLTVTNQRKDIFLLNPFVSLKRLENYNKVGIEGAGVAIERIGAMIYHDYNRDNSCGREQTARIWSMMLQAAAKENSHLAVEGGNQYVLSLTDRLYNIPLESSNYLITDETVPFYQMVVHGMIPYTSDPGNLSSDYAVSKLKWIEYGCMPYFELTYQKSVNLKNTAYNTLFTSYYMDWVETAVRVYEEFNQRLKGTWDQTITEHNKVGEKLYKILYKNGTTIYINYNNREAVCEGYKINALDYMVIERGGIVK